MRISKIIGLIHLLALLHQSVYAQNNRLNTTENIGWYGYFGTIKISNKIGVHTEFQLRRNDILTKPLQDFYRIGVNYNVNPRVLFRTGYAFAETHAYGEYPINGFGKSFSEHRIFEMAQLTHKEGIIDLSHRFMLEQRYIGRYSSANLETEDSFAFWNRIRYMFRLQIPLKGNTIKDKTPYLATFDEVLVGFGKNVNANIFDQNRFGLLLGYRFNKSVRLEGGYLNQITQFGRQINGKNVFQNNKGVVMNANFTFDASKKK